MRVRAIKNGGTHFSLIKYCIKMSVPIFLLSFAACALAQEANEDTVFTEESDVIMVEEAAPVAEKPVIKEAAPIAEKKAPVAIMKEVTGEVSAIDKHCIAVVYRHDPVEGDYELPVTIKNPPRMKHADSLDQVKAGDTVTVEYEQITDTDADGKEIVGDKFAKTVILVKPAPPPKPEKEEAEDLLGRGLDSGQEQ